MQPTLLPLIQAIRLAYQDVLTRVIKDPLWKRQDMSVAQSRSLTWVNRLAARLQDLWLNEQRFVTHCKPLEMNPPVGSRGELLVDVHVVQYAEVASVRSGTPIPFPYKSLVAVESEFEADSRAWLTDLGKLFLVRAPQLVFACSRAGNQRNADLAAAQLRMLTKAVAQGVPHEATLLLALMPHPRRWCEEAAAAELDIHLFDAVSRTFALVSESSSPS